MAFGEDHNIFLSERKTAGGFDVFLDSRAQAFVFFGKGVQKVRGVFYGQLIKGLKQGADFFSAVFPVKIIVLLIRSMLQSLIDWFFVE